MAKSPRDNKEKASSFLADLDQALERQPVNWLQAVESLRQNQRTESPGHGDNKCTKQANIHHKTEESEVNTAELSRSNTASDQEISASDMNCADEDDDSSDDKQSCAETIDLIRARTATGSDPTPSSTPTLAPSTPVETLGDPTSEEPLPSSVSTSSVESQTVEQPEVLPAIPESAAKPSEQTSSSPVAPASEEKASEQSASMAKPSSSSEDKPSEQTSSSHVSPSPMSQSSEHPSSSPVLPTSDVKLSEQTLSSSRLSTSEEKPCEQQLASQPERAVPSEDQPTEKALESPVPPTSEAKLPEQPSNLSLTSSKEKESGDSSGPILSPLSSKEQPPQQRQETKPSTPQTQVSPNLSKKAKKKKAKKNNKKANNNAGGAAPAPAAAATVTSSNTGKHETSSTKAAVPDKSSDAKRHASSAEAAEALGGSSASSVIKITTTTTTTTTKVSNTAGSTAAYKKAEEKLASPTAVASQEHKTTGKARADPDAAAKLLAIQAAIDRLNAQGRAQFDFVESASTLHAPHSRSYARAVSGDEKTRDVSQGPFGSPNVSTENDQRSIHKESELPPYSPSTPQNSAISIRIPLPPIAETPTETQQTSKASEDGQSGANTGSGPSDLTPKSTSTTSTTWTTGQASQTTPHTTVTSAPSTTKTTSNTQQKHRGGGASAQTSKLTSAAAITQPASSSSSHAHPSPTTTNTTTTTSSSRRRVQQQQQQQQISHASGGTLSSRKPEGFFWQLDSHGFPCAMRNCPKRCNLWDGATVICPGCGPFSETRYCSREHLLEGIKAHWPVCRQQVFVHPCRESTIPSDVRAGPPMIPCLHNYDMPERHRQAVYFAMNTRQGDYFIFSDWADYSRAGFPADNVLLRCSKRLVYTVRFENAEEKDRFRRVLAICLFATLEVHALVDYLFRLIRDQLRAANAAKHLEAAVRYQLQQETNVTIQQYITGERHACETDWNGRNRRNCADAVCRSEYQRLLGSMGGGGLREVVKGWESTFWILRAARTTHPEVKDPKKRMLGEGFEGVAEEDQRVFRRGDGWDGAGTGDMEIEGWNEDEGPVEQ
ncbi:uncharacterized protein BP01DRAFT_398769 [Aspergillus saccharolyticus JOP 1030-1]|uniref:Uncharacterized protein n=1 Tax=Aspergillus saccharolyticus JOP 1030-1 TaxID=1450539 RepID=A0A318ZG10_9EURO|nr:hypothetical protein BP01DRAFT_398769 [Aspergillus saccharolyticus JOP 1030-1]PYH45284.1 hypothetical protein BP01DRAFT_398769 [Aspergillus saccharolyticus JOP 1030-1]